MTIEPERRKRQERLDSVSGWSPASKSNDAITDEHATIPFHPRAVTNDKLGSVASGTCLGTAGVPGAKRGRYRLDRVLGEGSFGRVYLGYDEELQRQVAIKVPAKERFNRPSDADAFLAEARIVAQLDHPNIVSVYDMGRADDGTVYVVSRYINGATLEEWAKQSKPNHHESAALVATIASALHYAHQQRLVHRDIKPANILIDAATKTPFVGDFGLAIRDQGSLRQSDLAGSPAYMSPEQARGEGHRLDGRSDLFSLGAILYQLLTGRRPFGGQTTAETLFQVINHKPLRPRKVDRSIPKELERICLRALSKRAPDRYATGAAMAEDLQAWLAGKLKPGTKDESLAIIPRGLRSFSAQDSNFFLKLLPGPRNRDGLPESIAFWKKRIEQPDPEQTFAVGLLYGPSGCGKSSLVKAGLIPNLNPNIRVIYVEATASGTERRILLQLQRAFPEQSTDLGLVDFLEWIRLGLGPKVVLVVDQFEQWLNTHRGDFGEVLPRGLRQCDGGRLQTILMVRDDFYLAAARLMHEIDVPIVTDHNFKLVDLFDMDHARGVLVRFGQAYGRLPINAKDLTSQQSEFTKQVLAALSQDGKVISVRLALLAEILKSREWSPKTLATIGGLAGIGFSFLEETFTSQRADPRHRQHLDAVRHVLRALQPEGGTNIKSVVRSKEDLLEVSGYHNQPQAFEELLQMLDGELRLITPAEPDAERPSLDSIVATDRSPKTADAKGNLSVNSSNLQACFQLTHDYLVPSLREWLDYKQRETRQGRAELKLAERTATWKAMPEDKQLPTFWEWIAIRSLTNSDRWQTSEALFMRHANRFHLRRASLILAVAIAVMVGGWWTWSRIEQNRLALLSQNDKEQRQVRFEGLVGRLISAEPRQIPAVIAELETDSELAASIIAPLLNAQAKTTEEKRRQLHLSLASVRRESSLVPTLLEELLSGQIIYIGAIRNALRPYVADIRAELIALLQDPAADESRRFRAALALSEYIPSSEVGFWSDSELQFVARELTSYNAEYQPILRDLLAPLKDRLFHHFEAIFVDRTATSTERIGAANALADYAGDAPTRLLKLLLDANVEQDRIIFPLVNGRVDLESLEFLREVAREMPQAELTEAQRVALGQRRAAAAIILLRVGDFVGANNGLVTHDDLESISQFAAMCQDRSVSASLLLKCWKVNEQVRQETNVSERDVFNRICYGLLITLGSYPPESLPPNQRTEWMEQLVALYSQDPSSGVHGACGWLLRRWGQHAAVARIDNTPLPYDANREWFVVSLPIATSQTWIAADLDSVSKRMDPLPDVLDNPMSEILEPELQQVWDSLDLTFSEAEGLLHTRFAYCQTMEFTKLMDVSEQLRRLRFRPTKVRPFEALLPGDTEVGIYVSAVWVRDDTAWIMRDNLTAEGIEELNRRLSDRKFVPLDVAGYLTQDVRRQERYIGIWEASSTIEHSELLVGVRESDHDAAWRRRQQEGLSVHTRQSFFSLDGQVLEAEVWRGSPKQPFEFWGEDSEYFRRKLNPSASVKDLSVVRRRGSDELRYSLVQHLKPDSTESIIMDGIDLADHATVYRKLIVKGFQPLTISVFGSPQELKAISVWTRPISATVPLSFTFIVFPAGQYRIGSSPTEAGRLGSEEIKYVKLPQPMAVADREVHWQQFSPHDLDQKRRWWTEQFNRILSMQDPVFGASWYEARDYCRWLSERHGLAESDQSHFLKQNSAGQYQPMMRLDRSGFRLPTGAEWEIACRSGMITTYSFGSDKSFIAKYGWFEENADGWSHPVAQLPPNARGLYDMHGNLSEWTHEVESAVDGNRFFRGGDFMNQSKVFRTSGSDSNGSGTRASSIGFRLAVSPSIPRGMNSESVEQESVVVNAPHNETAYLRNWHDRSGKFMFSASLLRIQDEEVWLRSEGGRSHRVKIDQLFAVDIAYIKKYAPITNSIGMNLARIPAGMVYMVGETTDEASGSVKIERDYYLSVFEVTNEQYKNVMGSSPSRFIGLKNPVEQVSWEDAIEFCDRLSALPEEKAAGRVYRLPTEAEWEHAGQSDSGNIDFARSNLKQLDLYMWHFGNSSGTTQPVGRKKVNDFGLHDMHGNVSEWCADWYGKRPRDQPIDPLGPSFGVLRVRRGANWTENAADYRTGKRAFGSPTDRTATCGFRVAIDVPELEPKN